MRDARIRLALASLLFVAWTGWLVYEAARTADPLVVSRTQILVAPIIVEADVRGALKDQQPAPKVEVRKVHRGRELLPNGDQQPGEDRKLTIASFLDGARRYRGWQGPGPYILCLEFKPGPEGQGSLHLVPLPLSPGFSPKADDEASLPSIYPVTESTLAQLAEALRTRP